MKKEITTLKKLYNIFISQAFNLLWVLLSILYITLVKPINCVVFLDVGQGDATLIQQGDIQILIDGGDDLNVVYELSKYMKFNDRRIEVVVLTHPHDDHLVGILEVMDRYEVGEIWIYPVCYNNPNYKLLLESGVKIREVEEGMNFNIEDIRLNILWPVENKTAECEVGKYKSWDGNINNDSLVIHVEHLNKSFLLMGDAEEEVEKELNINFKVDFLKAGHHCSKTSSSETFLKMAKPSKAICSCGEGNKFGHPSSGTLKNFSSLNVQYFVTYESGNIVVR